MLRLLALVLVALGAPLAHAQQPVTEIFKCRSPDGHWTYTNDRREAEKQKCEVVTRQVNVAPAQKPPPPSSRSTNGSFPRETPQDSANAKARQRDILEKELAQEQQALAKAKEELAAQENVRYGNERNYARVEERLQPFKDSVETHEKNIEALRRELGNLR
jgi:septal ring factor EnvC (AmiA/AmiB activator)